jgi:hypothetical protein
MEDFGYSMELLILKATEMELGTCWLGGTFTKSRFSLQMGLKPGEKIPAVTSIGYPNNQKAWFDRVARIYAGADRRLPWNALFFRNSWDNPYEKELADVYYEPLQLVRLAPSASNKQPWRILFTEGKWHFYLERTPNYPTPVFGQLLKISDLQRIDIGIALSHFELAVKEGGISGEWVLSEPQLEQPEKNRKYIISWQPVKE